MSAARPSRAKLLPFALVPLFPFLVALVIHRTPTHDDVHGLAGQWSVRDMHGPAVAGRAPDAVEVTIPGPLPEGVVRPSLVRTLTLDEAPTKPWLLVVGGFANGVAEVFVNDRWVGSEGVPATGYKLEHVGIAPYPVAPGVLRAGDNTIEVRLVTEGYETSPGVSIRTLERRLLIGPFDVVKPWFDRTIVFERLLDLGGIVVLLFLSMLTFVLSLVESERDARAIQRTATGLGIALAVYLAGKSGLALVMGFARDIIPLSLTMVVLTLVELVQRVGLGRITRVQQLNRVVCVASLLAMLLLQSAFVYFAFIQYMFACIVYGVGLVLVVMWRATQAETVMLGGAMLAMAVAGANDLLTDISLVATPRLFTLAATESGLIAAIVVGGRFVRAMRKNTELLHRVEEQNLALTTALSRAEESTRMKSAFLANTSHELRTPLNSIINVPEGLLEEFAQRPFVSCEACGALFEMPERYVVKPDEACPECGAMGALSIAHRAVFVGDADAAMRYLKSIEQSGRHLLAVVNDILDFSKLEAGKQVVHVEDVRVNAILDGVELAMRPLADARGILLTVERVSVDERMRTDALKVTQILLNFVSNAIKFSPEGQSVVVVAECAPRHVVFSVIDHGIGISSADLEKIFESFLQLDSSHTRKAGGTGLGLAISRGLAALLGGDVTVTSEEGRGSIFRAHLPRDATPPRADDER